MKKIVILDRYVHSNIAYQCAKFEDKNQKKNLEIGFTISSSIILKFQNQIYQFF